jgi:PQQ-dependent dehydrogenase (methanol/ethanol family)
VIEFLAEEGNNPQCETINDRVLNFLGWFFGKAVDMRRGSSKGFAAAGSAVAACTWLVIAPLAMAQTRQLPARAMPAPAASPADDGQWTMPAKNYASTRFSALGQINRRNVGALQVVFTFSTGIDKGHEAAPLVVGTTMYIVTPYPNILYALDLSKPGAPVKWTYKPKPAAAAQGVACCDVVNRGAFYSGGKLYFATLDGFAVAVDANSGKEAWRTRLGDINKGETITMAPLVAERKVLVGNSGGEMGVRGWLTALDAASGKIAWKAYSTGPDKDVLIGSGFRPFYAMDRGRDLGIKSWPPEAWKIGGGTPWGWISYDPDLRTIYYGTGNPGPWNPDQRPGDNKWTAGIFARDIATGQARWFYQFSPHDLYDHDAINEQILVDMPIAGRMRKVLLRPERNGYFYVIDRVTGQVLSADPYVPINGYKGVNLKTGRIIPNPEKTPKRAGSSAASAPRRRAPRTGILPLSARVPAFFTCPISTSAWILVQSRRTTSPERPMWARM